MHSTPGGLNGRQLIDSGLNKVLGTAMGRLEPFGTTAETDGSWRSRTTVREIDPSCCIEACIENRSIEREIALSAAPYTAAGYTAHTHCPGLAVPHTAIQRIQDTAYTVYNFIHPLSVR